MRSMTGFGEAHGETPRYRIAVTLRSVNHRFLDLAFRLREELRDAEPALRALLTQRLARGRVEVAVEATPLAGRTVEVAVDRDAVTALRRLVADLALEGEIRGGLTLGDLLRVPELVRFVPADPAWTEAEMETVLAVAAAALEGLVAGREREGRALRAVLEGHHATLVGLLGELRQRAAAAPAATAEALRRRIAEALGDASLDEARLAQEVAFLCDRSDVREEVDRLGAHLEHLASILGDAGSVGKRLDFLVQEIGRELNTLGSKSRDAEATRRVVDAKVVCEQIREQIQNVE